MDDLSNMISQVLSDPQAMQQLQSVAASLGLNGDAQGNTPHTAQPPPPQQPTGGGGLDLSALSALLGGGAAQTPPAQPVPAQPAPDLSALASLLGGGGAGQSPPAQPAAPATPDLSALSGILGGLMGGGQQPSAGGSGGDVSALTALLKTGQPDPPPSAGSGLPFDMGTLLKLQQAMSSLSANRANVEMLMALKPRLKPERAKKVDDAVRVMQLIQFLPLIKETGLFGDMENFLGGLGGGNGGLGSLVGGLGNGISGVLGNLLGGGGR